MGYIDFERTVAAGNYDPLPIVLKQASGVWVTDTEGRRYLDMMSAYSAVSLGHGHPRILKAMMEQASTLAVTSRAYYTDVLGPFLKRLVDVTGLDMALPMNTGAEAVETAIKAARRWGYRFKNIPKDRAEIIVARQQFPRPHHDDRGLLVRRQLPRRLRALSRAGSSPFRSATPQAVAAAITDEHLRDHDRADPGRGRHRRAARRLSARPARALRRARRAADPRRGPVRPWTHRALVRIRARRHPARTG